MIVRGRKRGPQVGSSRRGTQPQEGTVRRPQGVERVERLNGTGRKEPVKTWSRRCDIVPEFVGHTFMVHNGTGS